MAGFRTFATGEVLTAANVNDFLMKQSVMVFDDATARTSSLGAEVVEGMLTFNKDTGALEVFDGTDFVGVGGAVKEKRVDGFTGSGTFTVPAGVTYAIAHMLGGGGGIGTNVSGGAGGASSVAFASGTVSAPGLPQSSHGSTGPDQHATAPGANSGASASATSGQVGSTIVSSTAQYVVAGASVTPAESITVTVGAGGAAGTLGVAGGSGYVYIEYFEEA